MHAPIGILLFAAATLAAQEVTFSVDTKLVPLLVSVKDAQGEPVGTLTKEDFTVYDLNVRQEIALFEHHTELPLSIAILIDTSGSTSKDLEYETDAVNRFLRALLREGNPDDAASLYSFNDEVTLLTSFTRRESRLRDSMRELKASAGTSMYDALLLVSRSFEDRDGRHVIIVVTDGGDTTSKTEFREALLAAQFADATIYPVLVQPITNDAGRNLGGERALFLLGQETGGMVFQPSIGSALDDAFAEILRDLRTQYLLGYYPTGLPRNTPEFHEVRIELSRDDLQALTRSGYYEDQE